MTFHLGQHCGLTEVRVLDLLADLLNLCMACVALAAVHCGLLIHSDRSEIDYFANVLLICHYVIAFQDTDFHLSSCHIFTITKWLIGY